MADAPAHCARHMADTKSRIPRPFGSPFGRPRTFVQVPGGGRPAAPPAAATVGIPRRPSQLFLVPGAGRKAAAPADDPAAAQPAPPPKADPFVLEGFVRLDAGDRPARVSAAVWEYVFPPDRPALLRLAGRLFLAGVEPDEAVRQAQAETEAVRWTSGPAAAHLALLGPLFPDKGGTLPPPSQTAAACDAVVWTAERAWREILAHPEPEKAAFWMRAWRAPPGRCLVCGAPAAPDDERFPRKWSAGGGDAIHASCRRAMPAIGPAFGRLVIAEARRLAAEPPPPPAPGPAAEDDGVI